MTTDAPPPVVPLPAPFDRRLHLGPFPNARSALRFVAYAAAGAVAALVIGPVAWLPFLGGGFVLTAYRTDGRSLDEHLGCFVRWRLRQSRRGTGHRPRSPLSRTATIARIGPARRVAVLATGGVPVQFLPPDVARQLFEQYREWLRSLDEAVVLRMAAEPLADRPFRPAPSTTATGADRAARAGYQEMVRLLCRRRRRRVVEVMLWSTDPLAGARDRLERRLAAVTDALRSMGLEPDRRAGPALAHAVDRIGWSLERLE
jgi:hypothetical protein